MTIDGYLTGFEFAPENNVQGMDLTIEGSLSCQPTSCFADTAAATGTLYGTIEGTEDTPCAVPVNGLLPEDGWMSMSLGRSEGQIVGALEVEAEALKVEPDYTRCFAGTWLGTPGISEWSFELGQTPLTQAVTEGASTSEWAAKTIGGFPPDGEPDLLKFPSVKIAWTWPTG
jgi:hypothetical protein